MFHGRFIAWAKLSQAQLDVDITQLNRDIKDLTTKIEGLQKKLWISGAVIALGATVLIPVMALAGPLAPFVAVRTYRSHQVAIYADGRVGCWFVFCGYNHCHDFSDYGENQKLVLSRSLLPVANCSSLFLTPLTLGCH